MDIFNEEKFEEIIKEEAKEYMQSLTKQIIYSQLDNYIKNTIDWEYNKNRIRKKIEEEISKKVESLLPQFNEEFLNKMAKEISYDISEKLKNDIIKDIGYYLCVKDTYEEEE